MKKTFSTTIRKIQQHRQYLKILSMNKYLYNLQKISYQRHKSVLQDINQFETSQTL